ncbi:MAG: hypothetical protein GVY16_12245 [Planctomycetes bacterium]|jgi:hypothetical protein|nr:hypothetical protein [Planctomycetota bacterium]
MIYAALTLWMMLTLAGGLAIYHLLVRLLGARLTDWLMLPATVVSELAWSVGILLTGRPAAGGLISFSGSTASPGQRPTGTWGFFISMLAAVTSLAAGLAVFCALVHWIGQPVVEALARTDMIETGGHLAGFGMPLADLPQSWDAFVDLLGYQITLVGRWFQAWGRQDWTHWHTLVFAYLGLCFTVRLGQVRHDWRAALLAEAAILGIVAALGLLSAGVDDAVKGDIWFLLNFAWATVLVLLAATLLATAIKAVVQTLRRNE